MPYNLDKNHVHSNYTELPLSSLPQFMVISFEDAGSSLAGESTSISRDDILVYDPANASFIQKEVDDGLSTSF